VSEVVAVIRDAWPVHPRAAIVLGTGLGLLAEQIAVEHEWSYRALPHFARSTADGHRGRLLAGRLGGVPIVAMDGRFHAYEGYSFAQITFPIRVFAALGASFLIVSNASGGLNPSLKSGEILLIDDHVNLMGFAVGHRALKSVSSPTEDSDLRFFAGGHRYYDAALLQRIEQIAADEQLPLRRGTYIAMLGPNYETRAEYRWLRTLGDVVGMSTVPEVLAASELGLPVVALSIVTNVFRPDDVQQTNSQDVIDAAASSAPNLCQLITRLLTPAD
jgi:purine-nucleoside phosphorylase